jgi:FixJ family two-component response regulator
MNTPSGTLFVVDDEPDARKGVAALASSMGIPCETFASAEEFLRRYDASLAGCLLIDLRLGGVSGIQLQERLMALGSELPVIVVSAYADVPTAVRVMKSGAITVLEKPYAADALADAIRSGLKADRRRREAAARVGEIERRMESLAPRERSVMDLILAGNSNKVIASELSLSHRTVDRVRAAVFKKMGVDSAVELARVVAEARARVEE